MRAPWAPSLGRWGGTFGALRDQVFCRADKKSDIEKGRGGSTRSGGTTLCLWSLAVASGRSIFPSVQTVGTQWTLSGHYSGHYSGLWKKTHNLQYPSFYMEN